MACFRPLTAWQLEGGEIVFAERGKVRRELTLPCGQCIGCRLERSRQWAVRCVHESRMHEHSCFVTLTYNDDNVPHNGQLVYDHFQRFMKRLRRDRVRKGLPPVRFYMCGEYGEDNWRPHFHACLFGVFFGDREFYRDLPSGCKLYTSKTLEELWPFGFSSIGDLTFESAAYVSRYVTKKITGKMALSHYERFDKYTGEIYYLEPEFSRMSLKPGIGATWFDKYRKEVFTRDYVVIRGVKQKPPRYYDQLLADLPDDLSSDLVEYDRQMKARERVADSTPARLAVRETVAKSRLQFKKRSI